MKDTASNRTDAKMSQSIDVSFEYPVIFTRAVFSPDNHELHEVVTDHGRKSVNCMVYVDSGVADSRPGIVSDIVSYFSPAGGKAILTAPPAVIDGGERVKNSFDTVFRVLEDIADNRMCRHSYIIAVGGGALLDSIGFAASIAHRGMRFIRIPTTTLSQCDGGVGVKNGINMFGVKNFAGVFAPPCAVINDFEFLSTLPDRDWRAGIAEAFKVSIIKDKSFFDYLCDSTEALSNRDERAMEYMIKKCAGIHLEHIRTSGDPFELGSARPLDFGHWSAHNLEVLSGYSINHGEAVAIGIAVDSVYAMKLGFVARDDCDRILTGLRACGFSLWHDLLDGGTGFSVNESLERFREHLGGKLTITLPKPLGCKVEVNEIDAPRMDESITYLKEFRGGR